MRPTIAFLLAASLSGAAYGSSETASATFTVPLSGAQEVNIAHPSGGTGDPRASGSVRLSIDPAKKLVCYDFELSGLSEPMMAHIHEGAPLRNGPPVIILFTGTGMKLADCAPSTRSQLSEILADPAHYYVSVDTTEFPDGALRGQL